MIRQRIELLKSGRRDGLQQEKETERWLTRIVEEGDSAVEALITAYPEADRQRLRLLARSASQGSAANKAKRARRELLRAIRTLRA